MGVHGISFVTDVQDNIVPEKRLHGDGNRPRCHALVLCNPVLSLNHDPVGYGDHFFPSRIPYDYRVPVPGETLGDRSPSANGHASCSPMSVVVLPTAVPAGHPPVSIAERRRDYDRLGAEPERFRVQLVVDSVALRGYLEEADPMSDPIRNCAWF